MTKVNRWEEYCETTYNSLRANVHNWGKPEYERPITRIFYIGVFDSGLPHHTGFISEAAYENKLNKKKVVHDHYLSPQFVGRMILDNSEKYLENFELFRNMFWNCCATIVVTAEENIRLSKLTDNSGGSYQIKVPTNEKYNHLGIQLYKRPENKTGWKSARPTDEAIFYPEDLIEYEKKFLI